MRSDIDPGLLWYVVRASARLESKAAAELSVAGFDVYLPRRKVERFNKRSRKFIVAEYPLMPRYIFLGMEPGANAFGIARQCKGIEHFVPAPPCPPIPMPHHEVLRIWKAENSFAYDDTRKALAIRGADLKGRYPTGAEVQVRVGHILTGLLGTVINTSGPDRVHVDMGVGRVVFSEDTLQLIPA